MSNSIYSQWEGESFKCIVIDALCCYCLSRTAQYMFLVVLLLIFVTKKTWRYILYIYVIKSIPINWGSSAQQVILYYSILNLLHCIFLFLSYHNQTFGHFLLAVNFSIR